MSADNLTSAKKPLSPPSTQTPQPNPAQKNDHTPSPSQAEIPKPQNPPLPTSPTSHVSPPFPAPITRPNNARPAPRRRSTPDAGLVSPAATNHKHPPTNPNPAAAAPISAHSTVPTTAHTWPPAAYKMRSKLPGRVHVAQTGQRNERRSFSSVWDLVIPARGCAQTAAVRIPCRGNGM